LKGVPWWVAAGALVTATIANTAASDSDRLVNAVLAAVIVGAAVVVIHVRRQVSLKASAIVIVACAAAAVTALVTYKHAERNSPSRACAIEERTPTKTTPRYSKQ
jgi:uncharacterized membrane protein